VGQRNYTRARCERGLKERRNVSDLIEIFKMAKNLSPIPLTTFFELNTDNRTRGHSFKMVKRRCNYEVRRHFFSERVVNRWNMLRYLQSL